MTPPFKRKRFSRIQRVGEALFRRDDGDDLIHDPPALPEKPPEEPGAFLLEQP
jgi:hypothetical protein